jgi:hypothetical protein
LAAVTPAVTAFAADFTAITAGRDVAVLTLVL